MSRDPRRISRVLVELEALWRLVPDWRFGQLVHNVNPRRGADAFYVEDDEWIAALKVTQTDFDNAAALSSPETTPAPDAGLREVAEAMLQPIDHRSHEHPNWPSSECDECGDIRKGRFAALRAALAALAALPQPGEPTP